MDLSYGKKHSVATNFATTFDIFQNPSNIFRSVSDFEFMQFHFRSLQFFCRLNKISGVCPKSCMIIRHDHISSRTSKPRNPFSSFPMIGSILALVRITSRNDVGVEVMFIHLLAQRRDIIVYRHFYFL